MINLEYDYIKCPICESDDSEELYNHSINEFALDGMLKVNVKIAICKNCGFVFQNPVPTERSLNQYYSLQSECIDQSNVIREEYYKMHKFMKENVDYDFINKVLDIGCRRGELLTMFKNDGKNVLGVEPSTSNVEYLRNKVSIPVIKDMFGPDTVKKNEFDLIMLTNVLEHLREPERMLKNIYTKITDSGYLFINVPNLKASVEPPHSINIANYFSFQHLQYFTLESMTQLLHKCGYNVVKYYEDDSSLYVICNIKEYVEANLKNEYENNKNVVGLYVQKRQQSMSRLFNKLKSVKSEGIIIYGGGAHTTQLMQLVNLDELNIIAICDSDVNKHGMCLGGFNICSIDEINSSIFSDIIISSMGYQDEIYEFLSEKFPEKNIIKLYN